MRDITALIAGLRDPAIGKRQAAARELGRSGNPAATEHLGAALSDSHPKVRSECVQALGRLGEEDASPFLIRALGDPEPEVRAAAIAALGRIRGHRAVNALISCLKDTDERVRIGAAEILGKLGDARAIEPLNSLAGDPFSDVRDTAERACEEAYKKKKCSKVIPHSRVQIPETASSLFFPDMLYKSKVLPCRNPILSYKNLDIYIFLQHSVFPA